MKDQLIQLAYTVELQPGERLTLPSALIDAVGPGRWMLTVRPCPPESPSTIHRHDAFLNGYAPEDEGLYDDIVR